MLIGEIGIDDTVLEIAPQAFPSVTTPVCGLARNDIFFGILPLGTTETDSGRSTVDSEL